MAAATALGANYLTRTETRRLQVTRRTLPVPGLPDPLVGRTLVQLSDLHIGGWMDDGYIARTFERVRAMRPDFVAYTGDQATFLGKRDPRPRIERLFRRAPHGAIATVAVLGNHDYGHGRLYSQYLDRNADDVTSLLEAAGVTVLRNRHVEAEGLAFVGLDDLWSGRLDVAAALAPLPPERPAIHLCHNPDGADLPGWSGRRGWVLAGHTHGGQVKLPGLPPPIRNVSNPRYLAGEAVIAEGRRMYISRGVGYVAPVRFRVPPELPVFTLVRA